MLLGCLVMWLAWQDWTLSLPPPNQSAVEQSNEQGKKTSSVVTIPKSPDERIADYTWWVAAFTFALSVVSAFQIFFLIRSDKTARIMAETAQAQTANLAASAQTAEQQMLLTGQQADVQRKQHAIGRLQFLVANRPRLRIRHVTLNEGPEPLGFISWDHGDEVEGSLIVVNAGGTKATIVESCYRIYFSKAGLPAGKAPYDVTFHNLLIPGQEMDVGESCVIPLKDKIDMWGTRVPTEDGTRTLRRFEQENWSVYVMGQIRYRDEGGVERFMGFCRKRMRNGRYRPVKSPDYEYED